MGKKLTFEYIKSKFEEEKWCLLSTNYINARTKLECVCPNGHIHYKTWDSFKQGHRCDICNGKYFYTYDEVKDIFDNENYLLLSKSFSGDKTRLYFMCPNGHKHSIIWSDFKQGKRCGRCKGNIKITYDQVKEFFAKEGYTLLSKKYVKSTAKLDYICPSGHFHSMSWSNFNNNKRCPTCACLNNSGEKHHNWLGGKSYEPYCSVWSDKGYKYDIKKRDNNICQNPYCYNIGNRLSIHHINYDKKDCHPSNLITLCTSCNARANKDRDWHTTWYQTIMNKKFGYKY